MGACASTRVYGLAGGLAGRPTGASGCDVSGEGGAVTGAPTGGAVGTAAGTPILSRTDFGALLRDDINCNAKARPRKIPPHDQLALVNRLPACRVPITESDDELAPPKFAAKPPPFPDWSRMAALSTKASRMSSTRRNVYMSRMRCEAKSRNRQPCNITLRRVGFKSFRQSGLCRQLRTMLLQPSGSSDAPPTSSPSTSAAARSVPALPRLTEPPYKIGTASAAFSPNRSASARRKTP